MRTNKSLVVVVLLTLAAGAVAARDAAGQARPIPQGPEGTVTLPVTDYDRLLDRAAQPPAGPDRPPVPAVVGRAEMRARVDGDTVRGTLRLDGEVFQRGSVKVPLVTGATLVDARSEGRTLPVVHEGDLHSAVFTGPASFSVTLEWASAIGTSPGRASIGLPQPASSSVSAFVDLPGDPADVRVEPGLVTSRATAAGRTTIEIALERGRRAQVSWSVREATTQGTPVETRLLADVRSLLTIGDGDLRMVALVDITVVRGEPRTFDLQIPAGYEVSSATGSSLESHEPRGSTLTLIVRDPARRRHQFLVGMERPHTPGSFKMDTTFPMVAAAQRESGEAAIEGTGTLEVTAPGDDRLRRMDVRETNPSLRSLARQPLLAAFRYQRRPNETHTLALDVKRFADASVIAAAAEHAVATTLVTSEGRMLTEMALRIRNRAQPFMKVTLPAGATMLSVDVAGETAKPVMGADGTRIPLLRPNFRPDGPYTVSFVYLHAGQAFAKRGDAQMSLAIVDVPVSVLEWELFLPEQFSAKPTGGNVIPARMVQLASSSLEIDGIGYDRRDAGPATGGREMALTVLAPNGQLSGRIVDPTGAVLPGVTVTLTGPANERLTTVTGADGMYSFTGVPSGQIFVTSELAGFGSSRHALTYDQRPRRVDFRMEVGSVSEIVTVNADAPLLQTSASHAQVQSNARAGAEPAQVAPSQNVINLQRRVAGVLPVRVDVPRAGTQYRFVRPLVLEEATTVSFKYKTR
jgi:hypothetical protein